MLFKDGAVVPRTMERPAAVPHRLLGCAPVNEGRQLELEFADGSRYEVHSSWLKDSSPANRGADFYRTSAADVWKLRDFTVCLAATASSGAQLEVTYEAKGEQHMDVFE